MATHVVKRGTMPEEVRTVPKRGPVTYDTRYTALCGAKVSSAVATFDDSMALPYVSCDACLKIRERAS